MFEPMELTNNAVIKVISVSGGGGNAVRHMVCKHIGGIEFFTVNTDARVLRKTAIRQTTQIGSGITKGLDAGANPEVGRNAADEGHDAPCVALGGVDMVFITTGMGSGTGIGATPAVTEVARDLGIPTVAAVTKPFSSEGKKRMAFAEQGVTKPPKHMDSLITIPNDKLLKVLGRGISLLDAFSVANDVPKGAVQGIAEPIVRPGLINVDSTDIRTVMSEMDYTVMDSGVTNSEDRVEEATEMAISSPPLEGIDLSGVCDILANIMAGFDLRPDESETVGNTAYAFASDSTIMIVGTSLDPGMNNELRVTVIVTGINTDKRPEIALVTNKQVQQLVMDRYQQHGMTSLTQKRRPVAKVVNDNTPQAMKEPDYLDIPAFLHKQAD